MWCTYLHILQCPHACIPGGGLLSVSQFLLMVLVYSEWTKTSPKFRALLAVSSGLGLIKFVIKGADLRMCQCLLRISWTFVHCEPNLVMILGKSHAIFLGSWVFFCVVRRSSRFFSNALFLAFLRELCEYPLFLNLLYISCASDRNWSSSEQFRLILKNCPVGIPLIRDFGWWLCAKRRVLAAVSFSESTSYYPISASGDL